MFIMEITTDKCEELKSHVEEGLRHFGKVMTCIDALSKEDEEEISKSSKYRRTKSSRYDEEEDDDYDNEDDKYYRHHKHGRYSRY